MQHITDPSFTVVEAALEAGGVRVTLRAESSRLNFEDPASISRDSVLSDEFSDLVQRSLPALHEGLLLAHRQFSETLQAAYFKLLSQHAETLSASLRQGKRGRK